MVHKLRCPVIGDRLHGRRVACERAMVALWCLAAASTLLAQEPRVHYLHQGVMPPGAIGSGQLQRGGPLFGYYQPVEIKAPDGALVSLAVDGEFDQAGEASRRAGLLIGEVYRLKVMNLPLRPDAEVFPTIELIDRLYPPLGQQRAVAIPVELTREDLELALEGKFVTRVIYLEDPRGALPVQDDPQQRNWFEAGPGRDPLVLADMLGRPVAILRIGGRWPDVAEGPDASFLFGCPPFVDYPGRPAAARAPLGNTPHPAPGDSPAANRASDPEPPTLTVLPPPPPRPPEVPQP
jgi:hypothetical protein